MLGFIPLSVPLNFIPTTSNPQYSTSPAPLDLLQKAGCTCSPFASDRVDQGIRVPLNAKREARLGLAGPPPPAGGAGSLALPPGPARLPFPPGTRLPSAA